MIRIDVPFLTYFTRNQIVFERTERGRCSPSLRGVTEGAVTSAAASCAQPFASLSLTLSLYDTCLFSS